MMKKRIIAVLTGMSLSLVTCSGVFANTVEADERNDSLFNKVYFDKNVVLLVQDALNNSGFDCGTPDGIAGTGTRAAIQSFQEEKGLDVNGNITDELLKELGVDSANSITSVE